MKKPYLKIIKILILILVLSIPATVFAAFNQQHQVYITTINYTPPTPTPTPTPIPTEAPTPTP